MDIVGLNEAFGWERDPPIADVARECGFRASVLYKMEGNGLPLAVMARTPIRLIERRATGFDNGFLHVVAGGIHFVTTHLSPRDSMLREHEAAALAGAIRVSEPLLLAGDLNTLSPLDRGLHAAAGLRDLFANDEGLARKFLRNGAINYRPMQILMDSGLHDLGPLGAAAFTVPTPLNQDPMHVARMRLDYFMANTAMLRLTPRASIIHDRGVEMLSDHYPIECEIGARR